jgi:hypothetical protein
VSAYVFDMIRSDCVRVTLLHISFVALSPLAVLPRVGGAVESSNQRVLFLDLSVDASISIRINGVDEAVASRIPCIDVPISSRVKPVHLSVAVEVPCVNFCQPQQTKATSA